MKKKKEVSANHVCSINNIDTNRLRIYSDNNLLKKYVSESGDYYVSYEYSIHSKDINSLTVQYKEYILSRRAINPNWFFSKMLTYEIDINNINNLMNKYDEFLSNEKIRKEKEKLQKELDNLKKEIEKSKETLNSQRSSRSSYSRSSCNYSSGGGYSGDSYLTAEEQSDLADRMYERSHGHSRYDL